MEPLSAIGLTSISPTPGRTETAKAESSFADLLQKSLAQVNEQQIASDRAVQELHAGGNVNLHEVMIAMEEADISLRYAVQVRNKMLDAYQEIMRMQV